MAVRSSEARRHASGAPRLVAQRVHHPPAALRRRLEVPEGLFVRPGMERHGLLQEHRRRREGSSVHRHQLRVGEGTVPRRQDEHLGSARAAVVRLRLQGQEPRRVRRRLADFVQGHRTLLRPRGPVSRDLRRQGEPPVPARQPVSATDTARERRADAAQLAEEDEPRPHALPRRRNDGRPEAQQVSKPVFRTGRVQPPRRRLRHPRGLRWIPAT